MQILLVKILNIFINIGGVVGMIYKKFVVNLLIFSSLQIIILRAISQVKTSKINL
jgi:hypothetical protein